MKEDLICSKNQEIAKFMGLVPSVNNSNPPTKNDFVTDSYGTNINLLALSYNTDWNKIMEVGEHIKLNADKLPSQYVSDMAKAFSEINIEDAYEAISKIAGWYNWQANIKLRVDK
jgi:hypothetical protein